MATEVRLPELGEGVERADIVRVLVAPGDSVAVDQPLLEIETDKATVEVPSPVAGTVAAVAVEAGATLAVGGLIASLEADGGGPATDSPTEAGTEAPKAAAPEQSPATVPVPSRPPPAAAAPASSPPAPPAAPVAVAPAPSPRHRALAAPSVRKLAREIGVEIDAVEGSGANGRVSLDDVKAHARRAMEQLRSPAPQPAGPGPPVPALPDFSRWGPIERTPMRNVRRTVARRMSASWQTVPHVTQHDRADVGELEAVRRTLKRTSPELPLTVTAFAVAVCAAALREFPQFNASIDTARDEIVYKRYVNIGVAVDTERGLIVPVIPEADQKSLAALSTEIAEVAAAARTTGLPRERLEGGTFTITNLGGLGGTAFTPIVNYPEVAILGMSRSTPAPVWAGDRFEPRPMLPLSLSYDHRLIDGADAVRFLRWVAERLEHPLLLELRAAAGPQDESGSPKTAP